ncbi:MAG: DUF4416 family protein [Elusimicrobiota bacterium]
MGGINAVKPAKLFIGIIASSQEILSSAEKAIEEKWGAIDVKSAVVPFGFTDYYEKEMGKGLLRRWISFEKPVNPDELADIKLQTNGIEGKYAENSQRRVNLDPGYVELSKVVLASTKDFSHRIYIGKGIYAELTLLYKAKDFTALPWTYPDYQSPEAKKFLFACREKLKRCSFLRKNCP